MAMQQSLPIFFSVFLTLFLIINGNKIATPAPYVDCTSALMGMMDCLDFIESGSTIPKPIKSCCSGLEQVVKENVVCLCQTFDLSKQMGIAIDINKALSLSSACQVKTPPFSECDITLPGVPTQIPNKSTSSIPIAPVTPVKTPVVSPAPLHTAPVEAPLHAAPVKAPNMSPSTLPVVSVKAPSISPSSLPSAHGPSSVDCTSTLMGMMDCLEFIESGSTVAKPQTSCCSGLQQVVKKDVTCLCQTFDLSKQMRIAVDVNKTLSLPSVCHVQTPPFSECNISLPGTTPQVPSMSPISLPGAPIASPPSEDGSLEDGSVANGVQHIISTFTPMTGFVATLLSYYYLMN